LKVHDALPGRNFNSVLLNRYNGGNDYVGWHSDDEKLYGPTPEIASLSFGCDRDFILKRRTNKLSAGMSPDRCGSCMCLHASQLAEMYLIQGGRSIRFSHIESNSLA